MKGSGKATGNLLERKEKTMKLVSHNGRKDSSGRHNDRNFDLSKAPHIEAERSKDNRYYTYNGEMDKTFRQIELEYYKEHFSKALQEQNIRNIKNRHPERNKTIRDFHRAKQTRPEDKIIQVGDKYNHISGDKLWEIAEEYRKRFNEMYGSHCTILSMALHMDEDTPHVHIRRVWSYVDENGNEKVGEKKALEALGFMDKDPSKDPGKHNNPKIIFTAQERELLLDICRDKGVELETTTAEKRKHMETPEYKRFRKEINELEREREQIRTDITDMKEERASIENGISSCTEEMEKLLRSAFMQNTYEDELNALKKKSLAKRAAEMTRLVREAAEKALEEKTFDAMIKTNSPDNKEKAQKEKQRKLEHRVEILSKFIADKGYADEFSQYVKDQDKARDKKNPGKTLPDIDD